MKAQKLSGENVKLNLQIVKNIEKLLAVPKNFRIFAH